jgi:ATP/maltotriose-dependent transcriptional regulator MalT
MWGAGDIELAAESLDRSTSLYETSSVSIPSLTWRRAYHQAQAYAVGAWNAWVLGFPDRARRLLDQGFGVARASDSRAVEESVNSFAVQVLFLLQEQERTRESAVILVELANEMGNLFRRAIGELYLGWYDSIVQGRPEGIARMRQALVDFGLVGFRTNLSYFLSILAQVQSHFGQREEALVTIDEALTVVEETNARAFEAEVHRIKGELLLANGSSNAMHAEQSFRTAIEVARRLKAKGWQLRATTSIARLLRDTNRRDEARAMLADIYNWFTEGFDTADLKDAKALLEELAD